MGDLRKEMMNDMGANVMVDTIEYTIITVYCCKPSSQVTPFLIVVTQTKSLIVSNAMEGAGCNYYLATIPRKLLLVSMVMKVSHHIQPCHENLMEMVTIIYSLLRDIYIL